MIVITVLGTSDDVQEEALRALTNDLLDLCMDGCDQEGYVVFPPDRMKMDLGKEIVAQVFYDELQEQEKITVLAREIGKRLRRWCPMGTKIGVQLIKARTAVELHY